MAEKLKGTPVKAHGFKKHPVRWSIFVALFLLVAGVSVYLLLPDRAMQRQIATERQNFMQAQMDLSNLYNYIITDAGKPTQHKSVQFCSYTSVDFGQGTRSCSLNEYAFYDIGSPGEASSLARKFQDLLALSGMVHSVKLSSSLDSLNGQVLSSNFILPTLKQCGGDYRYVSDEAVSIQGFIKTGKPGLSIDLYCSSGALAEYYPVINE